MVYASLAEFWTSRVLVGTRLAHRGRQLAQISESVRNANFYGKRKQEGKGVRHGGRTLSNFALHLAQKAGIAGLRFVCSYFCGWLVYLQLRAHSLDLRGLFFDHGRETHDRSFQFRDPLLLFERLI